MNTDILNLRTLFCAMVLSSQIVLQAGGCGPAHPVKENSSGDRTSETEVKLDSGLAFELGFSVIAEHLQVHSSSLGRSSSPLGSLAGDLIDFKPSISRDEISFGRALHPSDPAATEPRKHRRLYFTFHDRVRGADIMSVSIYHLTLDSNNRWTRRLNTVPALHDPEHARWVISVMDIFMNSGAEFLSEVDTQVLKIELILADSSRAQVRIRFRISIPADVRFNYDK